MNEWLDGLKLQCSHGMMLHGRKDSSRHWDSSFLIWFKTAATMSSVCPIIMTGPAFLSAQETSCALGSGNQLPLICTSSLVHHSNQTVISLLDAHRIPLFSGNLNFIHHFSHTRLCCLFSAATLISNRSQCSTFSTGTLFPSSSL